MSRQRTIPILVIAILHLTGGGSGLLNSLCTFGSLLMIDSFSSLMQAPTGPVRPGQPPPPRPPSPSELMKHLNDNIPGYRAFTIGGLALSLLLDILLLSAGIGLLKMQPWARSLSLVYAPISILFRIGSFVYQLVWVIPAMQALYAKFMAATGFPSIMTLSSWAGAIGTLLVIIYPIAVIIVMLLPSTSAAFRGEYTALAADELDEEEKLDTGSFYGAPRDEPEE